MRIKISDGVNRDKNCILLNKEASCKEGIYQYMIIAFGEKQQKNWEVIGPLHPPLLFSTVKLIK